MKIFKVILLVILILVLGFVLFSRAAVEPLLLPEDEAAVPATSLTPGTLKPDTPSSTDLPSSAAPVSTAEPTPVPTPEPEPEYFTITAIGDLTLANCPKYFTDASSYSIGYKMNGDYSYPFKNTKQYFDSDELTIANLECNFLNNVSSTPSMYSLFYFPAPKDRVNVLVEGGVDFVTTANNHTLNDYGDSGYQSTCEALDSVGIPYGGEDQAQIITTQNGIRVGIYTAYNGYHPDKGKATAAVERLEADGADYIICMFHWPQDEGSYTIEDYQREIAHACVDAGADLIYGTHPHVLQSMEEYNGAIILYSMGNFCFAGHTQPSDKDTCIAQIFIKRDLDGTISNDSYALIPCCVSSRPVLEGYSGEAYNDYCPTPYTEGSDAYLRALSKINGTYEGGNIHIDYGFAYQQN